MSQSQNKNKFDFTGETRYNSDNEANVEIIDMSTKRPLNDPDCQHKLIPDPSDRIGDKIAYVCKCGVGFFLPENKNTT